MGLKRFEFATATRILFGRGVLKELAPITGGLGERALVVTGVEEARAGALFETLAHHGVTFESFSVREEPTVSLVQSGVENARGSGIDLVIGFGGGSAIDCGKAIAALCTNPGEAIDYLEVIGHGQKLSVAPLPFIAIPTTAGTGAEVTSNAVLGSPEHSVKVSLRSPRMLPRLSLVDPELTFNLPPAITASTGMDALTQLIEPYLSVKANPLTDAFCKEGIPRVARSLRKAYTSGNDPEAREEMSLASLLGGLALANAKLGAVHGFAGTFGGMFPAPHGAICARLLPPVMAVNLESIREQSPQGNGMILARFAEVARFLTGEDSANPEDGVAWLEQLVVEFGIPPLSSYGLSEADFPTLIEKASKASSMQGNPVQLSDRALKRILELAM